MRVLVTGGTGVVGPAAVRALVARGHEVRLFSRNAQRDVERWPRGWAEVLVMSERRAEDAQRASP